MKIFLVYPPGATDIAQPYTSLPCLTAVLKENGHSVIQRDLGIEAINFFTNTNKLRESWKYIFERLKYLKELEGKGGLAIRQREELQRLVDLLCWASQVKDDPIYRHEKAVKTIKNKKSFFNPEKLVSAIEAIDYSLGTTAIRFFPTIWKSGGYKQIFDTTKVSGLTQALGDKKENIFINYFDEHVIPQIIKEGPDLLGISISFYAQLIPGLTLAKMVKAKNKDIHICLGGSMLMYISETLQKSKELFSFFDSVILYEGETALLELLKSIEIGSNLDKVPNIIFYNGRKIIKGERVHIEDMNSLPSPCYDGLRLEDYISPERTLVLNPSRGCYWNKCAFCGMCPTTRLKYRERKPEIFLKDILYANKKYGVNYFSFNSDVIPPSWLSRISTLILKNKLSIKWDSEVRFEDAFTEELCHKLYKAGCRYLRFGLESGNQRVLNLMRKGTNLKTIQKVIENCYRANIRVGLEAFVGFPGETLKEAKDTLNFIIRNSKKIGSAIFETFNLISNSPMFRSPKEFGITIKKSKSIVKYSYDYKAKSGISKKQANEFITYLHKKLTRLRLSHLFQRICNNACGSVYSILYANHYKTKKIPTKKAF